MENNIVIIYVYIIHVKQIKDSLNAVNVWLIILEGKYIGHIPNHRPPPRHDKPKNYLNC